MKKLIFILLLFALKIQAQPSISWEDSMVSQMTLEEKIGQLFMIAAYSNQGPAHTAEIEKAINQYYIGGLIFFQGTVNQQVYLTNYYQNISKTPLFIAQDAEWGINMRIKNIPKYPYAMTLGASPNNALLFETGVAMGKELKRMGVHINFAPVVDVNNNPNNPIIGFRSFGENRENVAEKATAIAHGLQSQKIIACAKHFPGHGNTGTDSHLDLPVLNQTRAELDSTELYPFRYIFNSGIMSAMVAHIHIPAIDNTPNLPASLSPKVIKEILRSEMNFQGLVFTDAMNMKGVSKFFKNGEAEVKALLADNDILLYPNDVAVAVAAIKEAIESGILTEYIIHEKVKKILYYKKWVGLNNSKMVATGDVLHDVTKIAADANIMEAAAAACITEVNNEEQFLPLKKSIKYAYIEINGEGPNEFYEDLKTQINLIKFTISSNASINNCLAMKTKVKNYDKVIISFHQPKIWSSGAYGYSDAIIKMTQEISRQNSTALFLFCNPYFTRFFNDNKTIVVAYEDEPTFRKNAAKMAMGFAPMIGSLPFKPQNLKLAKNTPLSYFIKSGLKEYNAQSQRMDTNTLKRIDGVLEEITRNGAAPGGQVLVARNGLVVYEKSFGKYTYAGNQLVTPNTIYDLASLTKVYASGLMAMKLYDLGKLDLEARVAAYIPETAGKAVGNIKIKDLMLHQAGLPAWVPFYKATLNRFDELFANSQQGNYQIPVAENMFMDKRYVDTMYQQIYNTPLSNYGKYKYSDLSLILLKKAMENIAKESLDSFVFYNFYKPLGLKHTGFNLSNSFSNDSFAPTEQDDYFRNQLLQGHVHDMASAMLGGVAGHAGLFSNTTDLLVLSELLRNAGTHKNMHLLNPETIYLFTKKYGNQSRRGLLFDKPDLGKSSPTSKNAPAVVFGHTGFTGTCAWVDPDNNLVYIFLSNRTYPTMENRTFIKGNYRGKIHDIIYESLK